MKKRKKTATVNVTSVKMKSNFIHFLFLNIAAPQNGLFAYLYDSETIYIGKSSGGKQHLLQKSKFRYISLKRALIAKGILQPPLKPITAAEREALDQIARKHCTKYVGILWDGSKKAHLDSAEKLLVFKKKPDGNATLKKRYRAIKPFKLTNKGKESILATLGLETSYEIP